MGRNAARVIVVERRGFIRCGLERVVEGHPDFSLVCSTPDVATALDVLRFADENHVIVLVESALPDRSMESLCSAPSDVDRIDLVAVDIEEGSPRWHALVDRGFRAGLSLNLDVEGMRGVLRQLVSCQAAGPKATPATVAEPRLTPREATVLEGLRTGRAPSELAVELDLARTTVSTVIRRLKDKSDVQSTHQLVARVAASHASGRPT